MKKEKNILEQFFRIEEKLKDIKGRLCDKMNKESHASLVKCVDKLEKEMEHFRVVLKLKKHAS